MADRSTFTQEEWETLYLTPLYVSGMVMMAGSSGFTGTLKEIYASSAVPRQTAKQFPNAPLIQALMDERNVPNLKDLDQEDKPNDGVAMNTKAHEGIRRVADILAQKATPEESDAYRKWLYAIAEGIANAAKEGSILGIGGQRVSAGEQEALKAIKKELGV
jgi:hypothetical protein